MASLNQPINNRKEYEKKYSKELKHFIKNAELEAYEFPVSEITPDFFVLFGLETKDSMLYRALNTFLDSNDIIKIHDLIYPVINKNLTALKPGRKINFSTEMIHIMKKAVKEKDMMEHEFLTSDHILLAILSEENGLSKIFDDFKINYSMFLSLSKDMHTVVSDLQDSNEIIETDDTPKIITMSFDPFGMFGNEDSLAVEQIKQQLSNVLGIKHDGPKTDSKKNNDKGDIEYCTNINKLAEIGKIDNITGRDDEITKIIEVLNRRKSNNIVIVGDPGVGKTALVEGLALKIIREEVPVTMLDKKIWKLNISSVVSGTQFRGMFEERMTKLIKKLKANKNNILFIDDIQSVTNTNKNSDYDIMGMLSEILNDGTVQVIVTTNHKGYRSNFETNNSFSSKFQKMILEKPKKEDCFAILKHIKASYEKHHNVIYEDNILNLCIDLAERYVSEKTLPTSAIDLMDEVGSHCFLRDSFPVSVSELKKAKTDLNKEKAVCLKNDDMDALFLIQNEIDEIDKNIASFGSNTWNNLISSGITITPTDVYEVVSKNTGVPINKLSTNEKRGLKNIENILKKSVIGQDEAISAISQVIRRNKLGLSNKNKPIGSFFMVGKSGCGKTLIAKKLAEEIFGDEKYLIRFDMSEYADKTSVNKLIGSSAGYVGYDEGGLLTEAIKKQKYSVLLIDEIEKANEEVFNLFLQILDEGFLTDNTGKRVDFKNTIIILTSNVGTKRASMEKSIGFNSEEDDKYKSIVEKELKNKFPPEFINRIDEIIYFNTLNDDNLKDIIRLELYKLKDKLLEQKYYINFSDDIVDYIFKIVEKDKEYGARPILRAIQREIENKVIDVIVDDDEKDIFSFEIINNAVIVR